MKKKIFFFLPSLITYINNEFKRFIFVEKENILWCEYVILVFCTSYLYKYILYKSMRKDDD